MDFDTLIALVGDLEWFDLATLVQLTEGRRETITNQLYRFARAGRIVPLRRGMYALAPSHRRAPIRPASLAGALCRPSYLSELWALSFHGVIPESVPVYTSVTSKPPCRYRNDIGEFTYRNVKRELFFGCAVQRLDGGSALVATPEKALFDFFHLSRGEWTRARMEEMRFSATGVDADRLLAISTVVGSPRVRRAASLFSRVTADAEEGVIEL